MRYGKQGNSAVTSADTTQEHPVDFFFHPRDFRFCTFKFKSFLGAHRSFRCRLGRVCRAEQRRCPCWARKRFAKPGSLRSGGLGNLLALLGNGGQFQEGRTPLGCLAPGGRSSGSEVPPARAVARSVLCTGAGGPQLAPRQAVCSWFVAPSGKLDFLDPPSLQSRGRTSLALASLCCLFVRRRARRSGAGRGGKRSVCGRWGCPGGS